MTVQAELTVIQVLRESV